MIRLYLDEDVPETIAVALRLRGYCSASDGNGISLIEISYT